MKFSPTDTLKDKIVKRISEINRGLYENKGSQRFRNGFLSKKADELYVHVPDYSKAKLSVSEEDFVVNAAVWQEFLVKEWLDKTHLDNIAPTKRSNDIFIQNRADIFDEQTDEVIESGRKYNEKTQCKLLVQDRNRAMGELLDFQVPLKCRRGDRYGELDIVARQDGKMVLIEYKIPASTEPLLRAVLEAITYFYQIRGNRPCESDYLKAFNKTFSCDCDSVGIAVAVPKTAYRFGHRRAFELIEQYGIMCYTFENESDFRNIVRLTADDVKAYREIADKSLQGIYAHSQLISSGISK